MNRLRLGIGLFSLLAQGLASELPAFPGAQGFGATTKGGRGGKIYFVTNLKDRGSGSFREACEATEPRVVLFKVSGTIALERRINIRSPFITIAGQSAPGDGICLRDDALVIATHDVVVRYLRSRLGDESGRQSDSISIAHGARNIVIDHCSTTWSVDEALSLSGDVADCTVQWSLIGQALNRSAHAKGAHGFGSLARAVGGISFHHNLWAHNDSRNPRMGDNYGKPPFPTFDVRHNVIYNYGGTGVGQTQGDLKINFIGNYLRPGPSTRASKPISIGGPSNIQFYLADNFLEGRADYTRDNARFFSRTEIDGKRVVQVVDMPFPAPPVQTTEIDRLPEAVLAQVGASLPKRDAVDARIVADARTGSGKIIDSPRQVGGWPELRSALPPSDRDNDGMPDDWEERYGLDPGQADHNADPDKDGYTNLEEFLNGTHPNIFVDYTIPGNNLSALHAEARQ